MSKVLLVEDDNNLREIYQARLTAEGYDIVTAQNGEEALVVAKQNKPDLIISDVMMPRISGFEMLDILRNTNELKNTKVIMLTALGQSDDQKRANSLGADRYLVKSQVTLEDIVNAAKELLDEDSSGGTQPAQPAVAAAQEPSPPSTVAPAASGIPAVAQVPDATSTPAAVTPTVSVEPVQVATEPGQTPAPTPIAAAAVPPATPAPEPVVPPTSAPAPAEPTPEVAPPEQTPVAPEPVVEPAAAVPPATPAPEPVPEPVLTPVQPPATPLSTPTAPEATVPATVEEPVAVQPEPVASGPSDPATPPEPGSVEAAAQGLEAEEAALQAQIASYSQSEPKSPGAEADASNEQAIAEAVEKLNSPAEPTPEVPPSVSNQEAAPGTPPAATGDNVTVAGKKIIRPINDPTVKPDINALLAKEEAKNGSVSPAPAANDGAASQPSAPAAGSFDPNTSL